MKIQEGKFKTGFFEWLNSTYRIREVAKWSIEMNEFKSLPQSAQFGLIQEWGDSVGLYSIDDLYQWTIFESYSGNYLASGDGSPSREYNQTKITEKLSEIYNQLK